MNAVATQLAHPDVHYARGREQKARGALVAAEKEYRAALALRPEFTAAWISLGILLRQLGRNQEAEACQREALRLDDGQYLAHLNLANLLVVGGNDDEARREFASALQMNPRCAEAHNNLGHLHKRLGRKPEAVFHLNEALKIEPNYFEAAATLGDILFQLQQFPPAIEALERANHLRPADLDILELLGRSYSLVGEQARAAATLEAVLERDPKRDIAMRALTTAQIYLGQYTKPRAALAGLVKDPECDDFTRFAFATLLLRNGEFREGWSHYDSRRVYPTYVERRFDTARWRGEELAGKTLLVTREQGLGDEIMFASTFAQVRSRAQHVIVECDQRLTGLYGRSFPDATIFGVRVADPECPRQLEDNPSQVPPFDYWTPIGDLPRHFRNEPEDFPPTPYLFADAERVAAWRERLARLFGSGLKVGLGWRGGVALTRNAERSLALEQLRPILALPNTHFVSLQYGQCAAEIEEVRTNSGITLQHWPEVIEDLDEYAALISALDVVVSVCSAVVHLGGALGRPVCVMAPRVPEWRYGMIHDSMIWYDSVRLFRQEKAGDWRPVINQVARALRKLGA